MKLIDKILWLVIILITAALFISVATSCTRTVYVPVHNQSVSEYSHQHIAASVDTVIQRDTVTLTLSVDGDTIRQYVTRWRDRIRIVTDTVTISSTDTIFRQTVIPAPAQATQKQNIPILYRLLAALGIILMVPTIAWIFVKIIKHKFNIT